MQAADVVGMGRIVGDGAIYFYIQDVAVKPEHQGRGVGRQIMEHLLAYLQAQAPPKAFSGSCNWFEPASVSSLRASLRFSAYSQPWTTIQ